MKCNQGRNKCTCSSSRVLCYGCVQSCAIHNSFASYGGMSFALVALKRLNISELKDWVTWSHTADVHFPFLRGEKPNTLVFLFNHIINSFYLWCKLHLKNRKFLFAFKTFFEEKSVLWREIWNLLKFDG